MVLTKKYIGMKEAYEYIIRVLCHTIYVALGMSYLLLYEVNSAIPQICIIGYYWGLEV